MKVHRSATLIQNLAQAFQFLRVDPLFKLACGRLPEAAPLASQPTHSRFENAIDARTNRRLTNALLQLYLDERGRMGPPARILIDADSTDDPTYGDQEGSAYHGYYQQHFRGPELRSGDPLRISSAPLVGWRHRSAHRGRPASRDLPCQSGCPGTPASGRDRRPCPLARRSH